MITLCFLQTKTKQKKHWKRSSRFLPEVNPYKKKKCLFKTERFSLSVSVGYSVAVCGGLLQLVVLEAVEGGSVALRGGAEQLLCSSKSPVFLLFPAVSWTGEDRSQVMGETSECPHSYGHFLARLRCILHFGVCGLTCASAGCIWRPRFTRFLIRALAFITVVVGNAGPTWSLWTYKDIWKDWTGQTL